MSLSNNFPTTAPSLLLDFANTKTLGSRVTFTRASAATYYNGTTFAKAEENLLTYSQAFDNAAWTKQALGLVANNATAPDGTLTGSTATLSAGAGIHALIQTAAAFASGGRTASIFVKAGTAQYVQISFNTDTTVWANFTVTSGSPAVGSMGADPTLTANIYDAGNGWYRCTVFTASTTATNFYVTIVDSSTSARQQNWTAAGTETMLFWGAQLEQRTNMTIYLPTTVAGLTNYNPQLMTAVAGVARFDCNPTTNESLGLLIEEQRTNLVTYSEQFDNAAWLKGDSTVSANVDVAPDGTLSVDKIAENTATGRHFVYQNVTIVTATQYTVSIFAKAAERSSFRIDGADANIGAGNFADFSLATATATASGNCVATLTAVGNGWYRASCVFTAIASGAAAFTFELRNASSNSYTGDGYSGILFWGAQLEAGAAATSYIPTVASQVTRSADIANVASPNFATWFNAGEFTVLAQGVVPGSLAGFPVVYSISDGTPNNLMNGYLFTGNGYATVRTSASTVADVPATTTLTAGAAFKLAGAFQQNNVNASCNGAIGTTDTVASLPTVNLLRLGSRIGSGSVDTAFINGAISKIAVYPRRIIDAQIQALTL